MIHIKRIDEMVINEGAGAAYDVTFKELKFDKVDIMKINEFDSEFGTDHNIIFKATIKSGDYDWATNDYYYGWNSENEEMQLHIDGGYVGGEFVAEDLVNDLDWTDEQKVKTELSDIILDELNDYTLIGSFGHGWLHVDLRNPIIYEEDYIKDSLQDSPIVVEHAYINSKDAVEFINDLYDHRFDEEEE